MLHDVGKFLYSFMFFNGKNNSFKLIFRSTAILSLFLFLMLSRTEMKFLTISVESSVLLFCKSAYPVSVFSFIVPTLCVGTSFDPALTFGNGEVPGK